jgi:hypothetical protein
LACRQPLQRGDREIMRLLAAEPEDERTQERIQGHGGAA